MIAMHTQTTETPVTHGMRDTDAPDKVISTRALFAAMPPSEVARLMRCVRRRIAYRHRPRVAIPEHTDDAREYVRRFEVVNNLRSTLAPIPTP
jgi:hypothetical protein